jgi:hypothetical protein
MQNDIDRRENERIRYKSPVLHSTNPPDFFYRGTMLNFSSEGLYFESNEDLLQGDEISISIKNPPPQFIMKPREYFDVQIRWCQLLESRAYQVGYGAKIILKVL